MNYIKKAIRSFLLSPMVFAAFTVFFIGCAESISIRTAPPQLPVYEQPICPDEGYIWVPGYWAYGPNGYFWAPEFGSPPRKRGFYGRRDIGAGQTATIFGMKGIGPAMWGFTAESITAMVMAG